MSSNAQTGFSKVADMYASKTLTHEQRVFGAQFDFPPTPARMKFVVLSMPRTGSTLLCSALYKSRQAGCPFEYLHPHALQAYMKRTGRSSLPEYINEIMARRTSPNGVFGIKLHYGQFFQMFCESDEKFKVGLEFLKFFDRFILTHRKNKVDQAVSQLLAEETGIWNSNDPGDSNIHGRDLESKDIETLLRFIATFVHQEFAWRRIFGDLTQPKIELSFEDLIANPPERIGAILRFLGISLDSGAVPSPETVRLTNSTAALMKERFFKAIGVDLPKGPV
jgi:LPS sulfotransferase NodH